MDKKIIIIHKGGLGDFILSLPALISLKKAYASLPIFLETTEINKHWLKTLNLLPLPLKLNQAIFKLFQEKDMPLELKTSQIFWFKISQQESTRLKFPFITYLYLVNDQKLEPVQKFLRKQLHRLNLSWEDNWKKHLNLPARDPRHVLLFPGSGHKAKNWPLENFLTVYNEVKKILPTYFVLGYAEKHLKLNNVQLLRLNDLTQLIQVLSQAKFVLGNDSGPMHLASLLNVPGLVLFGPTPKEVWQPENLNALSSPHPCAPCSLSAKIDCQTPSCMQAISPDQVFTQIKTFLKNKGSKQN